MKFVVEHAEGDKKLKHWSFNDLNHNSKDLLPLKRSNTKNGPIKISGLMRTWGSARPSKGSWGLKKTLREAGGANK